MSDRAFIYRRLFQAAREAPLVAPAHLPSLACLPQCQALAERSKRHSDDGYQDSGPRSARHRANIAGTLGNLFAGHRFKSRLYQRGGASMLLDELGPYFRCVRV